MYSPLVSPVCGKTGQQSGDWVRLGVAAGELLTALDPQNCPGCWDTMTTNGLAAGTFTADGNGDQKWESFLRPETA